MGWTWINKSDWHPCSSRLDYSYRQPKRWGKHNMWQSDSHVSRHHRGQILTEAGELNPKAITKCQPGLITSFKTNVNMSNYNSSCVCRGGNMALYSRLELYWDHNLWLTGLKVICVCVCARHNYALFHRKIQCNLHLEKINIFVW